jgi:hypothetical protein
MDRSPTPTDNATTINGPPEPKTAEEEMFCREIQRKLLEAELRATDITGQPLSVVKFLRGPRVIGGR